MALDERVAGTPTYDSQQGALLFMHIPKTAGTSLRHALAGLYDDSEQAYLYESSDLDGAIDPGAFDELPPVERARFRLVMGHFGYGIHAAIPGPSSYVTMVRDAVDRVASLFHHYKSHAAQREGSRGWREQEVIAEGGLSLQDWVFGQRRLEIDNGMVRMISGRRGVVFGTCPDDMLTEALEHVAKRFDAVLVRERMSQSMELLEALIGRRLPPIGHHNVNPSRDRLDSMEPAVKARILDLNRLDAEFYRITLERFPATYDRLAG